MSRRLYPHKRLRYWKSYDIDEICRLFADKKLHAQTVRSWVKAGLKTIDNSRPILIYGDDLITFLKNRNDQNKCPTAFDELYCPHCRDARNVFRNRIVVEQKGKFLSVKGQCRECKSRMFQNYSLGSLPKLRKKFKLVEESELDGCASPSDNTHLEVDDKSAESESGEWRLL